MFELILVLDGAKTPKRVMSNVMPEAQKAYVFLEIDEKPHFIAEVENYDNEGTFRIIEGNPLAYVGAREALKNPITAICFEVQ